MSHSPAILRFQKPVAALPDWVRNYEPSIHHAAMSLRDAQLLADQAGREHTAMHFWPVEKNGQLEIHMCGRGGGCLHKIMINREADSWIAILRRIDAAAVEHVDECLGRNPSGKRDREPDSPTPRLTLLA